MVHRRSAAAACRGSISTERLPESAQRHHRTPGYGKSHPPYESITAAALAENIDMQYETLGWRVEDGILTLTLNRPDQLNAFTVQMANELIDSFGRASEDDGVRAVVVTGAGRAFCAGMDLSVEGNVFGLNESLQPQLSDMHDRLHDPVIHDGLRDTGGRVTLAIYECKKPVIAAINGPAVGIGATMTLAMDIRLACNTARIGFVFGNVGILPEACSSWFLPRLVGMQQALEWIYSAEIFDVDEAKRGGLVKAVYAPGALLDEAYKLARKFTCLLYTSPSPR